MKYFDFILVTYIAWGSAPRPIIILPSKVGGRGRHIDSKSV
jgi:hypothetical protein